MESKGTTQGYSVDEFMSRWGIGRSTFYKELATGNLKTIKVGRRRIVTQRGEFEWIKAKEKLGGLH
jgi:predicted DNA-binding transcriptional regulator AlpA